MNNLVVDNLRLKELIFVVNKNKPFFDEFLSFIRKCGYENILALMQEVNEEKLSRIFFDYFDTNFTSCLYDGIARPYDQVKSKWFFVTWLLRDAPQQRLQPILSSLTQGNITQKRVWLIIKIIRFSAPLMPNKEQWEWPAIAEVMLQRLEGSRRALKGNFFEAIVRDQLAETFKANKLKLQVTSQEIMLNNETYDIEIIGSKGKILMPVKTRETMGGGHALLFTRDIHKSISVAHEHGLTCVPIIIAESWGGNLNGLPCVNYIYISANPNQIDKIVPLLKAELQKIILIFAGIQ